MSKNKNSIGIKNYIQVALMFIAMVIIVLYLSNWYSSYKKDKLSVPVIDGVLSEINYEELDPYLRENDGNLYLYMCTSDEDICRNFEEDFIKIIEKENLYDKILYLNITNVESKTGFLKEFNKKYASKKKVSAYPTIVYLENGKIKEVLGKKRGLSIKELKEYLDEVEMN